MGINNKIVTNNNYQQNTGAEFVSLNEYNQYIASVNINNIQNDIKAIIDTGASLVTINSKVADLIGVDYKNNGTKINVSTASEKTDGYRITLNSIRLGSINISDLDAIVLEGDEPSLPLIGMNFLKHLELHYNGNRLELTIPKNHQTKNSIKHN